jgi:hypothetical protein
MTFATLPEPALDGYTGEQVRFAASAWPMRAAEELRSALIFRALARASRLTALEPSWTERFRAASRDEVSHATLCAAIGVRLGAPSPTYDRSPVRVRLSALADSIQRTAALLLVEVAVGETVSTSLFSAGLGGAIEPLTRAGLTTILRDEVGHSQLGWSGVAALWPSLTDGERSDALSELKRAFVAFEQHNALPALRRLEAREPFDPVHAALGVLSPAVRVEAFYSAIEGQVIPRLARLGIDGESVWERRYRAS